MIDAVSPWPRFSTPATGSVRIDRSVAFYEKLGFAEVRRMPIGEEAINVSWACPEEIPAWS